MKFIKALIVFLSLFLFFSFTACDNTGGDNDDTLAQENLVAGILLDSSKMVKNKCFPGSLNSDGIDITLPGLEITGSYPIISTPLKITVNGLEIVYTDFQIEGHTLNGELTQNFTLEISHQVCTIKLTVKGEIQVQGKYTGTLAFKAYEFNLIISEGSFSFDSSGGSVTFDGVALSL